MSKIAALLISILQTTNDETLSTQATENKRNETASAGTGSISDGVDESIENLSTIVNLAKSKLTKPKKARLPNTKANSETDFLILRAKKNLYTFIKGFYQGSNS